MAAAFYGPRLLFYVLLGSSDLVCLRLFVERAQRYSVGIHPPNLQTRRSSIKLKTRVLKDEHEGTFITFAIALSALGELTAGACGLSLY